MFSSTNKHYDYSIKYLCECLLYFLHKFQNVGEIERRLSQLAAVENHLENSQRQMDEMQQLIESSEREIEGYKQCLNADDLEAIRNSYRVRIPVYYSISDIAVLVY